MQLCLLPLLHRECRSHTAAASQHPAGTSSFTNHQPLTHLRRQRPVVDGPVQHAGGARLVHHNLHAVAAPSLAAAALDLHQWVGVGDAGI